MPGIFFGTLREHYILLFGIAGGFAAVVGFVAAWAGAQLGAKRAAREVAQELLAGTNVALEVERLSEGQRFTARLLSERPAAMPVAAKQEPARVITPH